MVWTVWTHFVDSARKQKTWIPKLQLLLFRLSQLLILNEPPKRKLSSFKKKIWQISAHLLPFSHASHSWIIFLNPSKQTVFWGFWRPNRGNGIPCSPGVVASIPSGLDLYSAHLYLNGSQEFGQQRISRTFNRIPSQAGSTAGVCNQRDGHWILSELEHIVEPALDLLWQHLRCW